ncbi:MAG: hypothetical protein P3A27_05070 [Gemmatimonadota bacterium]|nr:hypothetical protein [Gemmatimonadota bacterium]
MESIIKLIDGHVPLPARPQDGDVGWLGVLQDQHERVMRLGGENDSPAKRESLLLELYRQERKLQEGIGAAIDDESRRAQLAQHLEEATGESHVELLEEAARLQGVLREIGWPEQALLTPEQTFSSLHIVALLRSDVESLNQRLQRLRYLAQFGITASVSMRGRQFLSRVGRLYVSGFYPEAIICGAAAIEEELEQLLESSGNEGDRVTLGVLIGRAKSRRRMSDGACEAARRLQARRDHLLHLVMDSSLTEREMQACLRDIGHVLSEICR